MHSAGLRHHEALRAGSREPCAVPRLPRLQQRFVVTPVLLPVVGPGPAGRLAELAGAALGAGADGVFIEAEGLGLPELRRVAAGIRARHPRAWIGLSFGPGTTDVGHLLWPELQGLCISAATGRGEDRLSDAVETIREWHEWNGLIFGRLPWSNDSSEDHAAAAVRLSRLTDAIVLEQTDSHSPPDPDRIGAIKHALGSFPLGLAGEVSWHAPSQVRRTVQCILPQVRCDGDIDAARSVEAARAWRSER